MVRVTLKGGYELLKREGTSYFKRRVRVTLKGGYLCRRGKVRHSFLIFHQGHQLLSADLITFSGHLFEHLSELLLLLLCRGRAVDERLPESSTACGVGHNSQLERDSGLLACGVGNKLNSQLERASGLRCRPQQPCKGVPLTCGVGHNNHLRACHWPAVSAVTVN